MRLLVKGNGQYQRLMDTHNRLSFDLSFDLRQQDNGCFWKMLLQVHRDER